MQLAAAKHATGSRIDFDARRNTGSAAGQKQQRKQRTKAANKKAVRKKRAPHDASHAAR
ncbi:MULTISPECIES: hypothetical protein [unclassified Caballeronia]|uniref:hypothetical protein n=1 Tax=unclassified Caballeronia TaxID=2646786 RepID=UPI00285C173E|nr:MULTISPECIES: hypothetical protein [unclassified Caballeronia]MDR5772383.1 hypothetical protein [Caballeronia sp. LZ002]MDR5804172.1 hypothetical protein [Caballeronia sp. LZ001]MDR5847817.1 hypothetical protein [Caballeronia sp. LZ003]